MSKRFAFISVKPLFQLPMSFHLFRINERWTRICGFLGTQSRNWSERVMVVRSLFLGAACFKQSYVKAIILPEIIVRWYCCAFTHPVWSLQGVLRHIFYRHRAYFFVSNTLGILIPTQQARKRRWKTHSPGFFYIADNTTR